MDVIQLTKFKKQHYVPRYYLRNFCSPGSHFLYCFDKETGTSYRANIQDIAHENLFYGLSGGAEYELEQSLARLEALFVRGYNELLRLKNYRKLSSADKGWLCLSLGFQLMRSNETRLKLKEGREKMLMDIARKELLEEKGIKIPDGVRINFTDPEYVKALHIDMMTRNGIEPMVTLANHFGSKTWVVLRNVTDVPLWTSDNPISFYNSYGDGRDDGIISPGVEIRYPLSSKLLLFSYDPKTNPPHSNNDKMLHKMVDFSNERQIVSSTRFTYSSSNDFDSAKKFLERNPEYKKPSRSRW